MRWGAIAFLVLLTAPMASAANNVVVHFNYPYDTIYIGDSNYLEIWIENDATIQGMSLGFELAGYPGTIAWDLQYGNEAPLNAEPEAVAGFLENLVTNHGFGTPTGPDSFMVGGFALPPHSGFVPGSLRKVYTLRFFVPDGSPAGEICIDNIWYPPAGQWLFEMTGANALPPDYFGCVNGSPDLPDCPAVCFPVASVAPVAAFDFSPKRGIAPLAVNFYDQSTRNPTAWLWSFGDGDQSTERNPQHTYLGATFYYFPGLTVSNASGQDVHTSWVPIAVLDSLQIDFSGNHTVGSAPFYVEFTSSFNQSVDSLWWDFGDGQTGTEPNPLHRYDSTGTYTVTLHGYLCEHEFTRAKSSYIVVVGSIQMCGDVNCDGRANMADAVYLINYIFIVGSPVPCEGCEK